MARQPRIPMKSEIEQALLVLEHTERSTLVDCGADKRIRQLFKTTSTRRKAQDFDKSEMSPTKLAKLSHNQGRSALLGAEFCTDLVLETCDVEAAGALASTCGLARVRCEPKLKAWKALRRKIQNADLATIETILDKYVTSPRTMCWTLSRLSAMGGEGVAYEHGRRLKVSEAKGLTPKHVTEITKKLRAAEKSEKPLYGPNEHIGCPPKLARYAANHFSVKHVRAERPDVHGWTRHAGSKYWLGVWKLLANSAVSRNKTNGGRYVLERFVFPARSEEWVAVAEVRVAKRFYSHRLELVAQLEQTGPTHYLKVKPSLRGRADDTVDEKPATFDQCGAAPAWEGETFEVPAASMGAFTTKDTEARPRPVARKTPSRQFSSDSTPSRISSSGSNSDADLASNVYRSLSLTVSEADDETMASKRGALEVEKLLLENAIDDTNSDVVAARRCSARLREVMALLEEVTLAEEALAECNARPRAMSSAEKRAAEKRRLSRRQSRNEAKRHAPTP